MSNRRSLAAGTALVAALLVFGVIAAACGDDDAGTTTTGAGTTAAPTTTEATDRGIIRFTFAPDPAWDYINDSGIREQMEQEAGIVILAAPTWDEFGIYAGGHADVISTGDMEVPLLENESGRPAVVFGMYNLSRNILTTHVDNPWESICDIPPGSKIAIYSTVGPTLQWGVVAKEQCGTEYRSYGGDYELVLADITSVAQLALDKEVEVAQTLPDFSVAQLMSGNLKILNDGRPTPEILPELAGVPGYVGPLDNIFMSGEEWYDGHIEEVEFFLQVWQRALDEWAANWETIIESYPQHFSVTTDEEIQWMKDYVRDHSWFVESVYLTDEWIESASSVYALMRETGFMGEDEMDPRMEALTP
jgi:hypothetical protein